MIRKFDTRSIQRQASFVPTTGLLVSSRHDLEKQLPLPGTVPRIVEEPPQFKLPMEMYLAVTAYTYSRLERRFLVPSANASDILTVPSTPRCAIEFDSAFINGLEAVVSGKFSISGAYFEKAFRLLDEMVTGNHVGTITRILVVLMDIPPDKPHMREIGRMLLKQLHALVLTKLGPSHPHVSWTRGLLELYDVPNIAYRVLEVYSDAYQDGLGKYSNSSLSLRQVVIRYSATLTSGRPSTSSIISKFEALLADSRQIISTYPYPFVSVQSGYGGFLLESGKFAEAEAVLESAPFQLVQHRQIRACYNELVDSTCALAKSRAAQCKDELAEQTFKHVIRDTLEVLGPHNDDTLRAHQDYANFLEQKGRKDEVQTLMNFIEGKLERYMLRSENVEQW